MRLSFPTVAIATLATTSLLLLGGVAGAGAETDAAVNLAPSSLVTVSSQNVSTGQTAAKVVDGSATGYPGDHTREWATVGGRAGSWVDLAWAAPVSLNRVVFYDRPNAGDQVTAGTLIFSDGSSVPVPALDNAGAPVTVSFPTRTVRAIRLVVDAVSGSTYNVGLAEMEAWGVVPDSGGVNVARTAQPLVTVSSQNVSTGQTAAKVVDGSAVGYPGDHTREWATVGGRAGSWVDLAWAAPVSLNRVVFYDRPNSGDQVTAGTLIFSDGSSVPVPALDNAGAPVTVSFPTRTVRAIRLVVDAVSGSTYNVGLAEMEAWGTGTVPAPSGVNVAATANPTIRASSQNVSTGQTAAKVVDGSAAGYPGDHTREWATVGGRAGSWVQLGWPAPVVVNRVVLHDRPNLGDHVTSGSLSFSDGSSVAVPALDNSGGATVVMFASRAVTGVRFTATSVGGATYNVGLSEFEVWGAVQQPPSPPNPPFFVYGSLRNGQSGYYLIAGKTASEALTRMPRLDLYRLSGSSYPYVVPNSANASGVVGEVMYVKPGLYASTLSSLDSYERYNPSLPPDNQTYVRELRPTREGVPSWVYVAGTRQADYLRSSGILITSGDFQRW